MKSKLQFGRYRWVCLLLTLIWSTVWQQAYADIDFSPLSCVNINADDDFFTHDSSNYLIQELYNTFRMGAVPTNAWNENILNIYFPGLFNCSQTTSDGHCVSSNCTASNTVTFYVWSSNGYSSYTLHPDQQQWIPVSMGLNSQGNLSNTNVLFRSLLDIHGNICVQALLPTGFKTIGCKPYMVMGGSTATVSTKPCYLSESCYEASQRVSKVPNPMSSMIVQCFTETLQNLFFSASSCSSNILATMQITLRTAVLAALALYVILFGVHVMMGKEAPQKGEIFIFIIKMVLVIYFSIGFVTSNPNLLSAGGASTNHGLVWLYNAAMGISLDLGNLFLQTGDSSGLCTYDPSSYPKGYEYMALWDGLDCRIGYYYGLVSTGPSSLTSFSAPGLIGMLFPMILGSLVGAGAALGIGLLLLILLFITVTLMLSFAFFVINLYLVAFLAVAMLIFLAPIFVPMILFQSTRQYYDSWKSLLMGYTLQPALFMIVLGMYFSIMDTILYQDCSFVSTIVDGFPVFSFSNPSDTCKASLGYQMATYSFISTGVATLSVMPLFFFEAPVLVFATVPFFMVGPVITACFFAYLFYYFADVVNKLLGDLTGAGSLGTFAALKPTSVLDGLGKAAEAVGDWYAGKKMEDKEKAGKQRDGVGEGAGGGGKKPDDKDKPEGKDKPTSPKVLNPMGKKAPPPPGGGANAPKASTPSANTPKNTTPGGKA